jgi:hypothetical protein
MRMSATVRRELWPDQSARSFDSDVSSAGGSLDAGLQHCFACSRSFQLGGSLAGKDSCPASPARAESCRFAQQHGFD